MEFVVVSFFFLFLFFCDHRDVHVVLPVLKIAKQLSSLGTPVSSTHKTLPPRYNWNIVESGAKHHKPNQTKPKQLSELEWRGRLVIYVYCKTVASNCKTGRNRCCIMLFTTVSYYWSYSTSVVKLPWPCIASWCFHPHFGKTSILILTTPSTHNKLMLLL